MLKGENAEKIKFELDVPLMPPKFIRVMQTENDVAATAPRLIAITDGIIATKINPGATVRKVRLKVRKAPGETVNATKNNEVTNINAAQTFDDPKRSQHQPTASAPMDPETKPKSDW